MKFHINQKMLKNLILNIMIIYIKNQMNKFKIMKLIILIDKMILHIQLFKKNKEMKKD